MSANTETVKGLFY